MFPPKGLLSLILISLAAVDASPVRRSTGKGSTLSFATRLNTSGAQNIAEKDHVRARALNNAAHLGKEAESVGITNAVVSYTAQVGIGSPAKNYTLLIDTGSSNTWVGANKTYSKTSTSKDTGNIAATAYGSGNFSGEEWTDRVTLGSCLVIENQSIGIAESITIPNFDSDGILGLGPVDLTVHTVNNTPSVPTVMDNLVSQGKVSQDILGIYFVPASEPDIAGELTFGGYDSSVITSPVKYVPRTTAFRASKYWGIEQSISYDGSTILQTTAGIVDTGTSLILIATDAFQKYASKTGAKLDNTTGLFTITSSQFSRLKPLMFQIGDMSYALSPNAQIWPRSLNTLIGGNSSSIYLVVSDIGNHTRSGIDFVNGYTFLERYYSVFDTANSRIGFASTKYTNATTN